MRVVASTNAENTLNFFLLIDFQRRASPRAILSKEFSHKGPLKYETHYALRVQQIVT